MKYAIAAAVLGAAFLMPAVTAVAVMANPGCLPRSELGVHLAEEYGEVLIAQGLNNRGALIEIFATTSRERWTLTETDASGWSCLRAAGEYWNALDTRLDRPARQSAAAPVTLQKPEGSDGKS
ncbi:MAG: hypothetical protein WDZ54_01750 [Sneathiella sp.]